MTDRRNTNSQVVATNTQHTLFPILFNERTLASTMTTETAASLATAVAAPGRDDQLNDLLSSPSFSVASYLNLALTSSSSSSSTNSSGLVDATLLDATRDPEKLQHRMAELALQLQIQTQSCHEDIGRIGAELQAILPRCAADVGRLGVGLEGTPCLNVLVVACCSFPASIL